MRNAIRHAIRGAMHSGMSGGEPDIIPVMHALSPLAGEISTALLRGQGSATFTRSTIAHHRQPNNVYVEVPANEARIQGARRVENLATYSNDFEGADWALSDATLTTGVSDPDGGAGATTLTATNTNGQVYRTITSSSPFHTRSFWIRRRTGSGSIIIRNVSGGITITGDVTASWQRLSYTTANASGLTMFRLGVSGDAIDIYQEQTEPVANSSEVNASEYIPTTTAAVAKYFTTTNGNSVSSNVVTEAAGLPLHPTVSKKGANVLARYAVWEALTAYTVGDRVIPTSGSGTAGGNGYYYECDGSGTSGATEPTWPETIGHSEGDGSAGWENKGHYKLAGYLGEPAAINEMLHNRDWTDAVYTATNVTPVKDATGVDGVANAASTLTADAGNGTIFQAITLTSAERNSHVFVKRKTGTGTIEFTDDGGTSYTDITSSLSTSEYLEFDITTTQANPSIGFRIVTSGDEIEVDMGGCETGSVPSSPITTTTSSVTRAADDLSYQASGNLVDAAGTMLASVIADDGIDASGSRYILGNGAGIAPSYVNTAGKLQSWDGTATSTEVNDAFDDGVSKQVATRWETVTNKHQVISSGLNGAEGNYDGSWNMATMDIMHNATANALQGIISDIRIYKKDLGTTVCEELTSSD